jgi:hypothetical protein
MQIEVYVLGLLVALIGFFMARLIRKNDTSHMVYDQHIINGIRQCADCQRTIDRLKYDQRKSDSLLQETKVVLSHQAEEFKHIYEVIGRCEGLLEAIKSQQ